MAVAKTVVEILNLDLELVCQVKSLYPINRDGYVLRYSKELSDYGKCLFRIATSDPLWNQVGDVTIPHQYHVRVRRDETIVWAGGIVDNTERTRNYVEVVAYEYEFYLDKVLIRRDASTTSGDGKENYRTFKSGTMSSAVQTLINNAKADFGSNHPMYGVSIGTIDNPNYPQGFTNANGSPLTGGWNFSDYITLQFDYHTAYYVLKQFGLYTNCDFEITEDLVFNYQTFIGRKDTGITFSYGRVGSNIVDYNAPRLGKRMANNIWGIAADDDGKILHVNQVDTTSRNRYGLLQDAMAFTDVKALNFLKTRVNETLQFTTTFNDSPLNVVLDEKGYPLGQYGIGDIVTVKIKDHVIDYNAPRRIVGITVNLHNTGREMTTLQTNAPRAADVGQ